MRKSRRQQRSSLGSCLMQGGQELQRLGRKRHSPFPYTFPSSSSRFTTKWHDIPSSLRHPPGVFLCPRLDGGWVAGHNSTCHAAINSTSGGSERAWVGSGGGVEGSIGRPETKYGRGGKEEMDGVRAQRNAASSNGEKNPAFMVSSLCKLPSYCRQFGKWCRSPSHTNSTFLFAGELAGGGGLERGEISQGTFSAPLSRARTFFVSTGTELACFFCPYRNFIVSALAREKKALVAFSPKVPL